MISWHFLRPIIHKKQMDRCWLLMTRRKVERVIFIGNRRNKLFVSWLMKKQNPENQIMHICGLGASVECERLSEHSTRRD